MKSPSKCQYLSQQNEKKTKQNKTFEICKKPASIFKLMYMCVHIPVCIGDKIYIHITKIWKFA